MNPQITTQQEDEEDPDYDIFAAVRPAGASANNDISDSFGGEEEDLFSDVRPQEEEINSAKDYQKDSQDQYDPIASQYKAERYSPEELKNMTLDQKRQYIEDLKTEREYLQGAGFSKTALSRLSFGASERIDSLKPQEYESNKFLGSLAGEAPYYLLGGKLLEQGMKFIPKAYQTISRIASSGALVSSIEAANQVGRGEELDLQSAGQSGLIASVIDSAIRSVPILGRWFKGLGTKIQKAILENKVNPKDLPFSDRKIYEEKVVPLLMEVGEENYKKAYESAKAEAKAAYHQELQIIKSKHENDLYKQQQSKKQYSERVKEIEEANMEVERAFAESKQKWEAEQSRERVVQNAIDNAKQKSSSKKFTAVKGGEDSGFRPPQSANKRVSLRDEASEVVHNTPIENPTVSGSEATAAVRSSAKADQREVSKLYNINDELNKKVVFEHPELGNELNGIVNDLKGKGNLTPQEQQILRNAETTLDKLVSFDDAGNAIGFKEVSNELLLDQAKVLRNQMYYDYSEGNPTGVFNPLIRLYQDSAKEAAIATGNLAAAEANDVARAAHSEWARLYKNKYIKSFRNLSVDKPTALFESALSIDNYLQLDKVLSKTAAGQEVSSQIRRELVDKKLSKFFKNPKGSSLSDFNEAIKNLSPVLDAQESAQLRELFKEGQKSNYIPSKKLEKLSEPSAPKLQKTPKSNFREIESVALPKKNLVKVTPEMKEASKLMNITEDQAMKMADSVEGLRYLKKNLSGSNKGDRLMEEIYKTKVRSIFRAGKVKPKHTGTDLFDIINDKNNFDVLSEILGENETKILLEAAEKLGNKNVTRESLLKFTKKLSLVKTASMFGIF